MFVKRLLLGDRPTASNTQSGGEGAGGAMKNRGQKKGIHGNGAESPSLRPWYSETGSSPPPQRVLMCYWLFQANRRCCD